ncbi:Alpha-1,2-fucosyltransferase (fragment) [Rhodospirillaceae bacterium LM-1]
MTSNVPLVVTKISGGLGNQLFQYAAGLALAYRISAEHKLDLSWYEQEVRDDRRFNLEHFSIAAPIADNADLERVRSCRLEQDMTVFDERLLDWSGDAYLCGYWVGAAYFVGADDGVRSAFAFKNSLVTDYASRYVGQQRDLCRGGDVIALHIRRGDNTRPANFNRFHVHPNDYYEQACSRFPSGSVFVVFSDTPLDLEWCRLNLPRRDDCRYVYCDGHGWLFDFAIMMACDHLIKSMSTFSWWAAWLNPAPGRRIISPHPIQGIGPQYAHARQDEYLLPGWEVIVLEPGT